MNGSTNNLLANLYDYVILIDKAKVKKLEKLDLDYFYGRQGEKYSFLIVPKILFTEKEFSSLSESAKLLYSILLDRNSLSITNGEKFIDSQGRTFIYFAITAVMEHLGCAEQKAIKLMSELEKAGLIEKKRIGLGKANRIYVKDIFSLSQFKNNENHNSGTMKIKDQELRKSQCSNTESSNTDFNNNQSINPDTFTISYALIDSKSIRDQLLQSKGIPYYYASNTRVMVEAIHLLTSWNINYPNGYKDDLHQSAYEMFNECLIEMATGTEIKLYRMQKVNYAVVIDKINSLIQIFETEILIDEIFIEELLDDYISAITTKEVKDYSAYMKSCIWNSFSTYKVKFNSTVSRLANGLYHN